MLRGPSDTSVVRPNAAAGHVAKVYQQVEGDYGFLAPPITLAVVYHGWAHVFYSAEGVGFYRGFVVAVQTWRKPVETTHNPPNAGSPRPLQAAELPVGTVCRCTDVDRHHQ